nr:hypothetical protein CFP56_09042 [Quercus suber]
MVDSIATSLLALPWMGSHAMTIRKMLERVDQAGFASRPGERFYRAASMSPMLDDYNTRLAFTSASQTFQTLWKGFNVHDRSPAAKQIPDARDETDDPWKAYHRSSRTSVDRACVS